MTHAKYMVLVSILLLPIDHVRGAATLEVIGVDAQPDIPQRK